MTTACLVPRTSLPGAAGRHPDVAARLRLPVPRGLCAAKADRPVSEEHIYE